MADENPSSIRPVDFTVRFRVSTDARRRMAAIDRRHMRAYLDAKTRFD